MFNLAQANERKHLFMEENVTEKLVAALTRKDFLKLIAGAGLGFGIALTGLDRISLLNNTSGNNNGNNKSGGFFKEAFAQSGPGTWTSVNTSFNTGITAIHVALYNTGNPVNPAKIVIVAGSSFNKPPPSGWPNQWQTYNPADGIKGPTLNMTYDLFCCHQVVLPDGKIFFAGGTELYDESTNPLNCNGEWRGSKKTYLFNPATETMTAGPDMTEGRWYPTLINLADGRVAAFSGNDNKGTENQLVQIYNPSTNGWQNPPHGGGGGAPSSYQPNAAGGSCSDSPNGGTGPQYNAGTYSLAPGLGDYPRMHLMPSGLIMKVGFSNVVQAWNPTTSSIGSLAAGAWTSNLGSTLQSRAYGQSFLLPLENEITATEKGRILLVGGGGSSATASTQLLTFTGNTSFTLTNPPALNNARKFASQIILPDGKCAVFGGTSGGQGSGFVYTPERFDPDNVSAGWVELPDSTVNRTYHSTALLLPDGRVWTASGTESSDGDGEKKVQFYNPWYWTASRPVINGTPIVSSSYGDAGGTITISTPDAQQLDQIRANQKQNTVSLVRLNAVTHHYEPNQRLVWLKIQLRPDSNTAIVQSPLNANLAPPGYYMIHVLKGGVPSIGKIIKIPGSAPADQTTPTLTILTPSATQVVSGPSGSVTVPVSGTAFDNSGGSGIIGVAVSVDGGAFDPATNTGTNYSTWSYTTPALSDTTHTITARATDTAGNSSSVTIPIRVIFT